MSDMTVTERDYRDLCIEDLTSLVLILERERHVYRELLSVALMRLHDSEARTRRLEQQIRGMFGLDDEQQRYVQRGRAA